MTIWAEMAKQQFLAGNLQFSRELLALDLELIHAGVIGTPADIQKMAGTN